jgi:hypothetical protein
MSPKELSDNDPRPLFFDRTTTELKVTFFNPYPANVDKMAGSYQCQKMADCI